MSLMKLLPNVTFYLNLHPVNINSTSIEKQRNFISNHFVALVACTNQKVGHTAAKGHAAEV